MKGLLYKDFALITQRLSTLLLMLAAGACLALSTDGSFAVTYLTLLAVITGIGTQAYDEFDNGYPFLFTLPITRREYVNAKYLFCVLCAVCGWIIAIAVFAVCQMIRKTGISSDDIMAALNFIPIAFLAIAFMLPIRLKYGSEKSRIVTIMITGIVVAVVLAASNLVSSADAEHLSSLINANDLIILLTVTGIGLLSLELSRRISHHIMEAKEF